MGEIIILNLNLIRKKRNWTWIMKYNKNSHLQKDVS